MKTQNIPRFPLSEHAAHPHFDGGDDFSSKRTRGLTPRQLRRAYSFNPDVLGKGMKIAKWMRGYMTFVLPVIVFTLLVIGILTKFEIIKL